MSCDILEDHSENIFLKIIRRDLQISETYSALNYTFALGLMLLSKYVSFLSHVPFLFSL